jgi:hypothetical protein
MPHRERHFNIADVYPVQGRDHPAAAQGGNRLVIITRVRFPSCGQGYHTGNFQHLINCFQMMMFLFVSSEQNLVPRNQGNHHNKPISDGSPPRAESGRGGRLHALDESQKLPAQMATFCPGGGCNLFRPPDSRILDANPGAYKHLG